MNKRTIKKREAQYKRALAAFVDGIVRADGPISGEHACNAVIRKARVPDSVMLVAIRRVFKSGIDLSFDAQGFEFSLAAPYTYFKSTKFPIRFWERTCMFIRPSRFNRQAWKDGYRKIRALARHLGGLSFLPWWPEWEPLPLPV